MTGQPSMIDDRRAWVVRASGGAATPGREALDELLAAMGLPASNPLGGTLGRGWRVVVKPNLVFHRHYRGGSLDVLITNPGLIEAVCDRVLEAIGREGEIIIGDAPLQSCDWETLMGRSGLGRLPDHYARQGYRVQLADFRTMATTDVRGLKHSTRLRPGDPHGYHAVDLGAASLHAGRDWRRFRVTNYDPAAMTAHHNQTRHEYLISGSVLRADAVINLPKLKTHRKSGLTCALKNMVGINGCKDWLPHHSQGGTADGGDEYPGRSGWKKLATWLVEREETAATLAAKLALHSARRAVYQAGVALAGDARWEGSWPGNDTLWRTIVDLNRAAVYAGRDGRMAGSPQRRVLTIVDALVAGDGEGPMAPDPVPLGCLVAGWNPVAVETAATRLAGWPERALRHLAGAFGLDRFPLAAFDSGDVEVVSHPVRLEELTRFLRPAPGYRGLFEKEAVAQ